MIDNLHKTYKGRVVATNLPKLSKEEEERIKRDSKVIVERVQKQLKYLFQRGIK